MQQVSKEWVRVALDLASGMSNQDRFERLLYAVRMSVRCDASALLTYHDQHFIPLATNGLAPDVMGRRFALSQHPRLEAIARAGDIVRFPADSQLPDPYDGLIPHHSGDLKVHSCMGLPLVFDDRLIGAITIDALDPAQFDQMDDEDLRIISALAASSLNTALLMDRLERVAAVTPEPGLAMAGDTSAIIGQSETMEQMKAHIAAVADTDLSVLVMGETGVGKELVAQAVHAQSARAAKKLVYLNCAALPESVAESELFGHVKGAFTGAISNRQGKFELADGGTLFLDEVGELSLALQAKLLRALQYGDIQRVGDDRHIKVNVRIVAATNRQMHEEVAEGRFRADLYHRLSVFPIFVPPLRERGQDITVLAGFFAERCRAKLGASVIRFSPDVMTLLQTYSWPGNVRELEHAIHRAAVLARADATQDELVLQPSHFGQLSLVRSEPAGSAAHGITPMMTGVADVAGGTAVPAAAEMGLKAATEQFQIKMIEQAITANGGKLSAAARQLGLDAGNLHRLMKRLGLK
ncbi:transcriptional regulator [Photobacterium aquae]|uniref:Transcriptional regulator n=1 Tax=Photobacterium aquae TaxID=1195763 RepID=A0A0J1K5J6_9GAMM|nr:nitric oxide reductase transcriptional regulator NorR [Photobacterium aquae]KLV09657.1 transcriptional regulator [Photobacterium aquae]